MEDILSMEMEEILSEGMCCSCLMPVVTVKQADDIIKGQFREAFKIEVEIEGIIFFICQICLEKLNNAYQFFQQIQLSIQYLTENQNKSSIKNEENFFDDLLTQNEEVDLSSEDDKPLVQLLNRSTGTKQEKEKKIKKLKVVPIEEIEKEIENCKKESFKLTCFACVLCDYKGTNRKCLASHMSSQHNFSEKNKNYCSVCNTQVEDLKQHKAIHKKEWICKFCGKSLRKKMEFVDHLKRHAENYCKCPVCLKKFLRKQDLEAHSTLHENSKNSRFYCAKCDKGFKTEHFFDEHMEKHTRNACQKCGKDCRIPEQLLIHVCNLEESLEALVERSDKDDLLENKINENTEIFESESETQTNIKTETPNLKTDDLEVKSEEFQKPKFDEKALTCDICQKSYKSLGNLQAHIKGVHMNEYRFRCKFCNKGYVNRADVIIHENSVHSDTKLFICSTCGKGYATKGSLRTHMKLHGERNEACHICEKTFCRKIDLEYHLKKHQGVKPHLCPDCGMAFAQKSHLTGHMTQHSDIRPFGCPMCDKKFKKKELLKHHIKLHGEKPLKCPHCTYGCYKIYRLKCHMKMHDGDSGPRSNQCQLCEKTFKNKFLLQSHLQVKHNAIIE